MIVVDRDKCIGCGACVAECPEGFELKDGKSFVKNQNAKCLKDAIPICPVEAISEKK